MCMGEPTGAELAAAVAGQAVSGRFAATVAARGDEAALRHRCADGTFAELSDAGYGEQAGRVAAALAERGVGRGGRVLLMVRNRPEFHVIDVGALLAGATPISVYNSSAPEQVAFVAGHSGARHAVVEA